ncbi:ArnT family glycosyltransferase [Dulcicalothrix desertica]|nr:glycosyltransferase family 39 protein [Dulcicalothrix desertica]TWH54243.1 4-amino-4-deoxy-L-arabinose transferase-like glycosyltransferase [Dulcicalothrix desertica PCC 7102]
MLHLKKNIHSLWLKFQYSQVFSYVSLLFLILPLLLFSSGNNSLMAHDEGLYATRARFMFDSGEWIHPWNSPHHKTPGIYWIIALFYKLFGVNELSVRLPSMILGTLSIFILYEIGKIILDRKIAWLAAAIFSVEFLWLQYCRLGTPDVSMVFLVLSGILLLLKAELYPKQYSKRYLTYNLLCFLSGICFGLGLLVRSFMIILPIIALIPFLISLQRQHSLLKNPYLYIGFIVGLIPTVIWLWLSYLHYGNGSIFQLLDFVFQVGSTERHGNGIIFYMWNVPAKSFPWFFFALFGLFLIIRRPQAKYKSILVGFPVILFIELSLISTRLSHYSLCLFPFIALLAAVGLDALTQVKIIKGYVSYSFGIIGILLLFAGIITLFIDDLEIHKYTTLIIVLGAGWLILPIVWIQRHRFDTHAFYQYWLAGWLIPVWFGLAVLGYIGAFNDYNPEFRKFIENETVAPIIQSSPISLVDVGGKTGVLINFYTKNIAARVNTLKEVSPNNYAWIEESKINEPINSHVPYRAIGTVKGYSLVQVIENP